MSQPINGQPGGSLEIANVARANRIAGFQGARSNNKIAQGEVNPLSGELAADASNDLRRRFR